MPDTAEPPDMTTSIAGWIHRLSWLRDDVAFGLDPRGVAATLSDVIADLQETRKRVGQ